jgi:hypothetical protein
MRFRWPHSALAALACTATTLIGVGAPDADAATIIEAVPAGVQPCPLRSPGEPPIASSPEPVLCDDLAERTRERKPKRKPDRGHPPRRSADQPVSDDELGKDPFSTLGGRSPMCRRGVSGKARANCDRGGALAHPYPIGNYNFDVRIDTGVTRIASNFAMAVQTLASYLWLGLLYVLKGVLLLLEWAFSLDLLGDSLPQLRRALMRVHRDVLGEPWFVAAISVAGLWGIWRGLVQRRTIETFSGLVATVLLMVAGLVLISNPVQTVGYATNLVNQLALGLLAGASSGTFGSSEAALGDSLTRVFDQTVLDPWCSLEFGDIAFCRGRLPADIPDELAGEARDSRSVADLWLRFPAGGDDRKELYDHWNKDDGPLQPKVRMQKEGPTPTRLGLLLLIAIGLAGCMLLLGWLGLRLVVNAILALVLLLFAPAMLLAPAFGEAGRSTFIGWAKRLFAAIVSKAVYALLLALVLLSARILSSLDDLGWFATWLMQIVFWWGIFLKRETIVGWLSVGGAAEQSGGFPGVASLYYKARMAGWGLRTARDAAGGTAGALTAPASALMGRHRDGADAEREAVTQAAGDELHQGAGSALGTELAAARQTLRRDADLEKELRDTNRGLASYDTKVQVAKQQGTKLPQPDEDEALLLGRRDVLQASRDTPEVLAQARSIAATADRNLALSGSEFKDTDRAALAAQRRQDLDAGLPLDHERNLRFAGVDPRAYGRADEAERHRMLDQVRQAIERDRRLLEVSREHEPPSRQRPEPNRRQVRGARVAIPPERLREHRRAAEELRRTERRLRQSRRGLFRR